MTFSSSVGVYLPLVRNQTNVAYINLLSTDSRVMSFSILGKEENTKIQTLYEPLLSISR